MRRSKIAGFLWAENLIFWNVFVLKNIAICSFDIWLRPLEHFLISYEDGLRYA